jgi:hypothetical protein
MVQTWILQKEEPERDFKVCRNFLSNEKVGSYSEIVQELI